jgi:hypothetical protein
MKKTRKYRKKSKSKTKSNFRGGMFGMAKSLMSSQNQPQKKLDEGPHMIKTLKTMFTYGISAVLVGPLYLLAELLNIPMGSINNLSRKAFDDNKKHSFLHVPIHKMISGCPIKTMEPENFVLQDDMYIQNNVAVVSCDKKGKNTSEVPAYGTSYSDSFLDFFGAMRSENKLRHHVFGLFQYIENIRETDEGRKVHIQKLISKITDYKALLRCYIIYKSMSSKCVSIQKNTKTILKDEDVVKIVNPYYIPGDVSYTKKIGCVYKHLTKKRFDEEDIKECKPTCETCTFRNSVSRLSAKYASILSTGGCRVAMAKKMINTYYSFLTVKNTGGELPADEKGVVKYLDGLNVVSKLNGQTAEEEMVLKKFNTFMCKYDIIPVVKTQIEKIIKERLNAGYPMKTLMHSVES